MAVASTSQQSGGAAKNVHRNLELKSRWRLPSAKLALRRDGQVLDVSVSEILQSLVLRTDPVDEPSRGSHGGVAGVPVRIVRAVDYRHCQARRCQCKSANQEAASQPNSLTSSAVVWAAKEPRHSGSWCHPPAGTTMYVPNPHQSCTALQAAAGEAYRGAALIGEVARLGRGASGAQSKPTGNGNRLRAFRGRCRRRWRRRLRSCSVSILSQETHMVYSTVIKDMATPILVHGGT